MSATKSIEKSTAKKKSEVKKEEVVETPPKTPQKMEEKQEKTEEKQEKEEKTDTKTEQTPEKDDQYTQEKIEINNQYDIIALFSPNSKQTFERNYKRELVFREIREDKNNGPLLTKNEVKLQVRKKKISLYNIPKPLKDITTEGELQRTLWYTVFKTNKCRKLSYTYDQIS